MPRRRNNAIALLAAGVLGLAGCGAVPEPAPGDAAGEPLAQRADDPALGLLTSLPLYWPLGAGIADLVAGDAPALWQRGVIADRYAIIPLDTLTVIPALSPDAPEVDPLAEVGRLAVIQPRGLAPADNVALDDWVRGGGRLLLVLDPALTGDYDLPLGDQRRPVATALIPPVVARWGLEVRFDETQAAEVTSVPFADMELPLALHGTIAVTDPAAADCTIAGEGALATCRVGKGRVTLLADAALFEHPEMAGENGATIAALLAAAFE